jgi:hypothetical protein
MKANNINIVQLAKQIVPLLILVFIMQSCGGSGDDSPPPKLITHKLAISANEKGSAVYLNGVYTEKTTPVEIKVEVGEYTVGIGLKNSRTYLRKKVTVKKETETLNVALDNNDLQNPKVWKALFIGVNKVSKGGCISEYTTAELDLGYEFFNWSFKEKVEDYSYNTTKWEISRRDIQETIDLGGEKVITPQIIDGYITDIKKGDYDLIVTFFNKDKDKCFSTNYLGLAWYNVTELNSDTAYFAVRYFDDIENKIASDKINDPGVFIHEWLHTVSERFYPNRGEKLPKKASDNSIVHAAGDYGHSSPWMKWYEDIITGQVKDGTTYTGIGPDAFLECTVRESAKGECP